MEKETTLTNDEWELEIQREMIQEYIDAVADERRYDNER